MASIVSGEGERFGFWSPEGGEETGHVGSIANAIEGSHYGEGGFRPERVWRLPGGEPVRLVCVAAGEGRDADGCLTDSYYELRVLLEGAADDAEPVAVGAYRVDELA